MNEFLRRNFYSFFLNNQSKLASHVRSWLLKTDCEIDTNVIITNRKNFKSGKNCALYHGTYILNNYGSFSMADGSHLGANCYVNVLKGEVRIGSDVAIGPYTSLIAYSNHYKAGAKVTDVRIQGDIRIGNNVFIGAHCTILPETTINDNVVIGAGSVIKGELESNSIYAGVPCKKIKTGWYE